MSDLTETDYAILAVEAETWISAGGKENAARTRTGLTSIQYAIRLNQLLDNPAALTYDPQTVNRLRRIRDRGRPGMRSAV